MIVSEMTTSVQRSFGDDTESQITKADILRWLNEAQHDIARKTDVLWTARTISLTVGENRYTLPDDFLRVERVVLNKVQLHRTTAQDLDRIDPHRENLPGPDPTMVLGTPTQFYIRRKELIIHPAPDVVTPAYKGNMIFDYITRPAILVNVGDTPEVPVEFHHEMVRFALARAYELDGQRTEAQDAMKQYETNIGWALDEVNTPYVDTYPMIRSVD